MLKKIAKNTKLVLCNEEGASTVEWIIFAGVAFLIAVAMFRFKDSIVAFIDQARGSVDTWTTQIPR
ncbi:hypothetical protein [Peptoniphilus porci]|uniref:Uncharacterized protein n=1 Tax=Peptoniphilus porci TaxID=2652280 RepID=A0A1U7LXA7_9FIRM|nr:hypothetical protein [Peptoniphilus porci]OLR61606.1 hypothetical protein BIV18_09635 [Peptoniphilus porci]